MRTFHSWWFLWAFRSSSSSVKWTWMVSVFSTNERYENAMTTALLYFCVKWPLIINGSAQPWIISTSSKVHGAKLAAFKVLSVLLLLDCSNSIRFLLAIARGTPNAITLCNTRVLHGAHLVSRICENYSSLMLEHPCKTNMTQLMYRSLCKGAHTCGEIT